MKRITAILLAAAATISAFGQNAENGKASESVVKGVKVDSLTFNRNGDYMVVEMLLDLAGMDVESGRAVVLTPWIVNEADSVGLKSVGVYGRTRYYQYMRNGISPLAGKDEMSFRSKEVPGQLAYSTFMPYSDWMNGSWLKLHRSDYGCCGNILAEHDGELGFFEERLEFFPPLVYTKPVAEHVKSRSIEGSAFIDFVVNKTDIRPEYRNNRIELGRIRATIDSVKNDSDITITNVWLKGFASPESPYEHNKELAIGRTAAVKGYIGNLYHFPESIITTEYEPENWEGLRKYVEASDITHKAEILDVIDCSLEPDPKEWRLKSRYPAEYKILVAECYPALRRTDYRVAYNIREYSDIEEIRRLMATKPQNLSLNEFYLLAQEYEPGTEEFTEVFETAVRLYPDDEVANLNAANASMRIGNMAAAARYLAKAGDSAEAVYARGTYAFRSDDFATAERYMKQAKAMGIEEAQAVLDAIETINNQNK